MAANLGYIPKDRNTGLEEYFTPTEVAEAAMGMLSLRFPGFEPRVFAEPGCGNGAHTKAALKYYPTIEKSHAIDVVNREMEDVIVDDYLLWEPTEFIDLITTNPPFSMAKQFIIKSRDELSPGGLGLYLARYSLIATKDRMDNLWNDVNLREVWIIVPRPPFIGKHSDACEYAYFLFDGAPPSGSPRINWLRWKD